MARGKRTPRNKRVKKKIEQHKRLDEVRSEKAHVIPEVHEDEASMTRTTYNMEHNPLVPKGQDVILASPMHAKARMMAGIERRILISEERVGDHLARHVVKGFTTPTDIIDDMYSVLGIEARKFQAKALSQSDPLSVMETDQVVKYVNAMAKLTAAEQKLATNDELDAMTAEQLEATVFEMSRRAGILTDEQLMKAREKEDG